VEVFLTHYRSNLRDLEFNLFEVHRLGEYVAKVSDMDEETARDVIRELERLANGEWSASFVEADRAQVELVEGNVKLPASLKASLAALRAGGWDRVGLPEAMGGTPIPHLLFWATQELLLGANATATFYAGGPLFARVMFEEGTEEQRGLARLMIERGWAGSMVLTEPDAGSDVGAGVTRAHQIDGNTYHLEGVKRFITGGEHDATENIIHLVLARPDGAGPGTKGLSLFIVPKFLVNPDGSLGGRNGIFATRVEHKLGLKGSVTAELTLGEHQPAVGYLVGGVHDGIRQMFRVIEHARMMIGTKSAATLSTGYLNALEYAMDRVQGADLVEAADKTAPRVPIIRHPDVRRMLLLQKAHAEGLRALWTYAAWAKDQSDLTGDTRWAQRADFLLPLVKGYSSEKAFELLAQSLQVLGGSGYTQDYPIEQYLRDAKIDSIYEGTTGIQALDLFFRKIVRDHGQTVADLAAEVSDFVKGGGGDDSIGEEREILARILDDAQAHLGATVGYLFASGDDRSAIYRAGLHLTSLLESLAEVVISWQLLRHAEIAAAGARDDDFLAGKVMSAKFFLRHVAPKVAARRAAVEAEDGSLMSLADGSF
jgi:alkylation response protein AidB-like acyl-CoA dehydrogenase